MRVSTTNRSRFLHMKVLLHRPSFTSFCASAHLQARARRCSPGDRNKTRPGETELSVTLRTQCALVCVRKTCELVESLRNATTEDATGAWWFTLFCKCIRATEPRAGANHDGQTSSPVL